MGSINSKWRKRLGRVVNLVKGPKQRNSMQRKVDRETGEIVEGDTAKAGTVNDLWTFARDVRSQDPNWRLVETRLGN